MLRRLFSLLCAAALLAPQAQAAVFSVTNTTDSAVPGNGSLRDALTRSNAAGGINSVSWGAGSGGTITLGTDLPAINANTTLDATNAPAAPTIAGAGAMPLGGAVTFNNANAVSTWTISSVLSGAGSLTKTGAGGLALTGVNTYAGGTTLSGGILNVNSDAALGNAAGGLTFNGGTLQTAAGLASARAVSINGNGGTFDTNGFNSTLSGVISGGGALTKTGLGTLTLTGINLYTGGTNINFGVVNVSSDAALGASGSINFNGGTLQTGTAGITSARSVAISAAGGTFDVNGSLSMLNGGLSGSGGLTVMDSAGGGKLVLSAANSYSGGTTLNSGTLNLANNSALGSGALTFNGGTLQAGLATLYNSNAITLNPGGGLFDNAGSSWTLAGNIGGVGTLTSISTGTLFINGSNTYSGGTVINAGNLNILSDAGLGIATGTVTLNGGALQFRANVSSPRAMTLAAGGGTFDTYGSDVVLSGVLSGPGALNKIGTGSLTLSAASTYAGATNVNGGTLAIGADNVLPAATALTVGAASVFQMGGFNQRVASYVGPGTLSMTLGKTLTVAGNANVTNGTLALALPAQVVRQGQVFTPLAYGSVTGQFAGIQGPAALSFVPSYNAGALVLTTQLVPFAKISATPNQAAVGSGLEALRANPVGDAAVIVGNLYTLDVPHLQAALDQIGPAGFAALRGMGSAGSSVQSAAVGRRMAALADGTAPQGGFSSYSVAGRSPYPGTLLASTADMGALDTRGDAGSPWGFFASGGATTGRLQEANSGSGGTPGYAFNTGGLTGGADYRLSDNLAAGGSLGYLRGHASIYAPASGTVDSDSARYGVYGAAFNERARATLYVGGASDFFSTRRGIAFGAVSRTATASPRGMEFNTAAAASFDLDRTQWGFFSPFAGLNYDRLMTGAFTEGGADTLDLSVGPQAADSLQSSLGLRWSEKFEAETFIARPSISLGWRHEFIGQSRPINAQLATGGGAAFSVASGGYARDGTLAGVGIALNWGRRAAARLDYTGDFRSHFQDNVLDASFRWRF